MIELAPLVAAVQRNCHLADARHAGELTLCIYLLQMREQYRWERGLALGAPIDRAEIGAWLDDRERLWDALADTGYLSLPLGGEHFDPFDAEGLNARLLPLGFVYGAGTLASGRALFFVAELAAEETRAGLRVLEAGRELARGMAAPPAALAGTTVLLRREALRRWLWEQFEAWQPRASDGAYAHALSAYGHAGGDPAPALERMAAAERETLLLHEIGEYRAGALLGDGWGALRQAFAADRRIEPRLRALRDHLADCLVTLPALLEGGAAAPIHFWFSHLEGFRLEMFPRLAAAYRAWRGGDGGGMLRAAVDAGRAHWEAAGRQALALYDAQGEGGREALAASLARGLD